MFTFLRSSSTKPENQHTDFVSYLRFLMKLIVVMGINTTTSALLYKHAFMATWLEWWTVVAS